MTEFSKAPSSRSFDEATLDPQLAAVLRVFQQSKRRLAFEDVAANLDEPVSRRTLQRRLAALVELGLLGRIGERRGARYEMATLRDRRPEIAPTESRAEEGYVPISPEGARIREAVRAPLHERPPVSYRGEFLDRYVPNETFCLGQSERDQLRAMGQPPTGHDPAGTFANDVLDRFLIDLSFASSRLEGNTYSLLDTKHLIELGQAAQGKDAQETKMILNHKDAIEFLVRDPSCANVTSRAVKSLHAFLSDGLLANPADVGRLRNRAVGIRGSAYLPLALGLHIDEQFELLIAKAAAIHDPFEQALFLMVQLPYLQPFMDVNKRVSRLAANIPLVQADLCPLSFMDVPTGAYTDAMLAVYELNRIELLRDLFVYAYERSCQRYAAVQQSLQPPDTFRTQYRRELGQVIASIVRSGVALSPATVRQRTPVAVPRAQKERFIELVVTEFKSLNPDNAVRFGLRPLEFEGWAQGKRNRSKRT